MKIGQRIKERRKELCMSADELGEILGKNRATIYRYEKGEIENMPLDILVPIAAALKTTPQYLMGWDDGDKQYVLESQQEEVIIDDDLRELYKDYVRLDARERKIVKDLAHNLVATKSIV